jgi:hypothetical protein
MLVRFVSFALQAIFMAILTAIVGAAIFMYFDELATRDMVVNHKFCQVMAVVNVKCLEK